jgi:menaquinone-dependent protoporphyrinogen IX oxidase
MDSEILAVNHSRALIVYGTRWGGTIKVAEKIGEILRGEGYLVDIFDAKNSSQVDPYDLIIVGSGISGGKWTKEAEIFLQRNAAMLRVKKTALFVSCGMVEREKDEQDKARKEYLVKVSNKYGLTPIGYGFFGGVLDFKAKYNTLDRILVNSSKGRLKKMGVDISKPYDFRDWDQIEDWTHEVAGSLLPWIEVV